MPLIVGETSEEAGPANDLGPRHLENCLRRAIECGEAPVAIKREETLPHPLKESFDKGLVVGIRAPSKPSERPMLALPFAPTILNPFYSLGGKRITR